MKNGLIYVHDDGKAFHGEIFLGTLDEDGCLEIYIQGLRARVLPEAIIFMNSSDDPEV